MSYKTDGGGKVFQCNDIKIMAGASTWSTRLSQIRKMKGEILISTYSLPNMDYIQSIFDKRPYGIKILANSKFKMKAQQIKKIYPKIEIRLLSDMHKKTLLIEPDTVYIGSANFGSSGWREDCIGHHSKDMFQFLRDRFYEDWEIGEVIE